jgi:ferredoxin
MDHALRCREEGLVHLMGRNKLDSVWLNVGPADRLLTVCNCCPCCCLWKILPELSPLINGKLTRMPGISVHISEKCVGCGSCTRDICFVNAIRLENGRARIGDQCRGCGRCLTACPSQAIELRIDDQTYIQTTIRRIANVVEVR